MDPLTWDDTYAIARALVSKHVDAAIDLVSLNDIYNWVLALEEFEDDPELCNDNILLAIYRDWFEEVQSI